MATIDNIYIQKTALTQAEKDEKVFKTFSIAKSDTLSNLLNKIADIDKAIQYFKQDFSTLKDKAEKHHYICFMSKLIELREALEIATGQISVEDIRLAGRSFARKTQDPIGVF